MIITIIIIITIVVIIIIIVITISIVTMNNIITTMIMSRFRLSKPNTIIIILIILIIVIIIVTITTMIMSRSRLSKPTYRSATKRQRVPSGFPTPLAEILRWFNFLNMILLIVMMVMNDDYSLMNICCLLSFALKRVTYKYVELLYKHCDIFT